MFLNKNVRLAYAGNSAPGNSDSSSRRKGLTLFDSGNGETEDFNAFGSSAETEEPKKPKKGQGNGKKKGDGIEINGKSLIIAIAAVVAVVLLIVLIVAIANAGGKDIKYEDNTFASYEDGNGSYHVAMNGYVLGKAFDNAITVHTSADRSFAYVVEDADDGYSVYILENKKLTLIVDGITEVLAYAGFTPGLVYNEGGSYYHYYDGGSERITKDSTSSDFVISDDGTTVAYTTVSEDNASNYNLYVFSDGISEKYAKNLTPVAIAQKGKYIYAYGVYSSNDGAIINKLYVLTEEDKIQVDFGGDYSFTGISYMNVKGDELLIYTGDLENGYASFVYSVKANTATRISKGICTPLTADNSIVQLATLKKALVNDGISNATYYIDKAYSVVRISNYSGKIEPSGKYFYYINSENTLYRIDITNESGDSEQIDEDVVDFAVTQKGNVYYLNDEGRLTFQKRLSTKGQKIADDVVSMVMYDYSNTLYFEIEDTTKTYCTKEGSAREPVTFDSVTVTSLPDFDATFSKRSFAYFYDEDGDCYKIFYTSNGKSFKTVVSEAYSVNGMQE